MNREVQSVLLILLGGATLRISSGDIFLRYVKAGMRPWLLATGVLLLVLGVWALVDIGRDHRRQTKLQESTDSAAGESDLAGRGGEGHEGHGHGHGHGHGKMRIAWLLLLPVFAILLIAPPALGAYSAERDQSNVAPPSDDVFDSLPPNNPVALQLNDYAVRAVWDDKQSLAGRTVALVGFVTPANTKVRQGTAATWMLTRLTLTCCAADAVATKVLAVDAAPLPADTWVQVTGTWLPVPNGGDTTVARVKVQSVKRIPEPHNPYE